MAYDPTNGEKPIDTLPGYDNTKAGGDVAQQRYYAGQEFYKLFGRNPTQSELDSLAGAYAGDKNITNSAQGNQAIAQYFQNFTNTPDQIAKNNQDKYLKEAPQHYDAVNQVFQSSLGRAATQDELDHFGSQLAAGTLDPYSLQQFVQQQPEYQTTQNQKFQSGLKDQLSSSDQEYFNNNILPSLQEAYAKQGRSFDSSSFKAAATNSAQQQNVNRDQFLANLSASQYGGVQDRAYQDYANQVANQNALTNAGINATYTNNNNLTTRLNNITDYNTQQQAYNQYLAKYGKRSNGLGTLIGGVAGAGIGALGAGLSTGGLGAGQGAAIGWQLGSGLGGATQNSFGGSY